MKAILAPLRSKTSPFMDLSETEKIIICERYVAFLFHSHLPLTKCCCGVVDLVIFESIDSGICFPLSCALFFSVQTPKYVLLSILWQTL